MPIRLLSLALMLTVGAVHTGTIMAGTVMESENRDVSSAEAAKKVGSTVLTYAQGGKLRAEQKPGDSYMIFRDDTIYTINNRQKSYVAMDRAAMKRMAEQVGPAMKQMQEQMAKMPPEQRAQMEKMMGNMPGMKQTKHEMRKTTRADKISGYACSYAEMYEDGVKKQELCVAPTSSIKGGQDLLDAAKKMSALMQEMLSGMDAPWLKQMVEQQTANYEKLGGVPVLTRHFYNGQPVSETTLKSIRAEAIPPASFELPAGYTRKDMAGGI